MKKGEIKPKAVIFDLEGTLIDTIGVRFEVLKEISQRMGLKVLARDDIKELMRSNRPPWHYIIPEDRENRDRLIKQCYEIAEEIWPKIYAREARPIPQAVETLERLGAAGIRVGIASASWRWELNADDWGERIYQLAEVVITREHVPAIKPAPDSIIECLRRLEISPSDAVCVGDSPLDIKAGKAAGTTTIGVLTGVSDYEILQKEDPDMILPGVGDLLTAIAI